MFTGIIESLGQLRSVQSIGGDVRLCVESTTFDWSDVQLGDSIATNGVCLTVIALASDSFQADVSVETLSATTAKTWSVGRALNLEKALLPTSRLGGHMVSGHVDGVGEVLSLTEDARSLRFRFRAPKILAKYIAEKGSITIDGTSLTVNVVDANEFEVNIVPHTLKHTIMGGYTVGTRVNLEVDLIARYLERLLLGEGAAKAAKTAAISESFLADNGYLKSGYTK